MIAVLALLSLLVGVGTPAVLRARRPSARRAEPAPGVSTDDARTVAADASWTWLWETNLLGVFTASTSAASDVLGYRPAELIGRNIALIMDPHELARARAVMQSTGLPDSGLSQLVALARHRDGSSQWWETSVQAVTGTGGSIVGFAGRSRYIGPDAGVVVTAEQTRARVGAMISDRLLMTAFQPIVDLSTGRAVGVEALSRFVAQPGEMPEAWFTAATSVGMGRELEMLAVGTALTTAAELPRDLYVSINVSPLTCLDDRLADMIRASSIDLERIVLELTEHTEVSDYPRLIESLKGLRRGGVRIAVDDAGAGFASGRHILKVRPDIIKLDRGLISNIDTDLGVRALTAGMVAMAKQIAATVTAEGIATSAELNCVRALGIESGQGYLFGRPSVTPAAWTDWGSATVPDELPSPLRQPAETAESAPPAPPSTHPFTFSVAVLDAIPDATAILDSSGIIIAVNKAWRMFGDDNGGSAQQTGVGVSYVDVCARAAAAGVADAVEVLAGLKAVLAGDAVEREWEYACSSPSIPRWFISRITAIDDAHGGAVVSHVNISRRKRSEQELAHQASHDPLTGLANRMLFTQTLTEALQRRQGREKHADVGLLYIDIDDFKPVNDAFGHAAGDELLLMTTHRLRGQVRQQDTVARLGGDEFAVCAPRITAAGLAALADRIGVALGEPVQIHGQQLVVSASVGVYLATTGDTAAQALHAADLAMYKVKSARSRRTSLVL